MSNRITELEHSTDAHLFPNTCYKQPFRVLNCYAGIGGNRKYWDAPNMKVTAIEFDENIASVYKDLYPNDTVIEAGYILNDVGTEIQYIYIVCPAKEGKINNWTWRIDSYERSLALFDQEPQPIEPTKRVRVVKPRKLASNEE